MKSQVLKIHRWLALVFSLPLVVVIDTGLILSFEPLVVASAMVPGTVKPDAVVAALKAHDPGGRARMVALAPATNSLVIRGGGGSRTWPPWP